MLIPPSNSIAMQASIANFDERSRLAPSSKSLARYGKIAAAIAITFCFEGGCRRTKRHEMFEPELRSWHWPCIISARLV